MEDLTGAGGGGGGEIENTSILTPTRRVYRRPRPTTGGGGGLGLAPLYFATAGEEEHLHPHSHTHNQEEEEEDVIQWLLGASPMSESDYTSFHRLSFRDKVRGYVCVVCVSVCMCLCLGRAGEGSIQCLEVDFINLGRRRKRPAKCETHTQIPSKDAYREVWRRGRRRRRSGVEGCDARGSGVFFSSCGARVCVCDCV
jgi:hypothetical protein